MHQVPDDFLADVMPVAKKIAAAGGFAQYNVLQVIFIYLKRDLTEALLEQW